MINPQVICSGILGLENLPVIISLAFGVGGRNLITAGKSTQYSKETDHFFVFALQSSMVNCIRSFIQGEPCRAVFVALALLPIIS